MDWITDEELLPFTSALEEVQKEGHQSVSIMKCTSAIDAQTGVAHEDLVGDMEVAAVLSDPEFLETIRNKYGDGVYIVKLWNRDLTLHSDHTFMIGEKDINTSFPFFFSE